MLDKNLIQETRSIERSSMNEEKQCDNFYLWKYHKTLVHRKYKRKQTKICPAETTNLNAYTRTSQPFIS